MMIDFDGLYHVLGGQDARMLGRCHQLSAFGSFQAS